MAKLGRPFELVVADVVRELDPDSNVQHGPWLEGPDGARELDILVEGAIDGSPRRIQIECRDYNPDSRPIGIAHIDALESKHRDLNIDVSLLCSNAGFTADAVRKASRLGIKLIGVLREDDPRIRYRVIDEVYIRRLDFLPNSASIHYNWASSVPPQRNIRLEDVKFEGLPVVDWLKHRILLFISSNLVVRGVHSLRFRFEQPIRVSLPTGFALMRACHITFEISGSWFAQRIEIDATSGLYDWMHRSIRLGGCSGRIVYKQVKFGTGGTRVKCPLGIDLSATPQSPKGEINIQILDLGGLDPPKVVPQLDQFVLAEDLELVRRDIPLTNYHTY